MENSQRETEESSNEEQRRGENCSPSCDEGARTNLSPCGCPNGATQQHGMAEGHTLRWKTGWT